MAKISCVKDLPDWFKLEKYSGTENFNAAEWVEQLSRRIELLKYHPDFSPKETCKKDSLSCELGLLIWQGSHKGRADEVEHIRQFPLFSHGKDNLEKHALAPSSQPIKPISLLDLRLQKDRDSSAVLGKRAPQAVLNRWEVLNLDNVPILGTEKIATALFPVAMESHIRRGEVAPIISVDLNATNSVLIAAFSAWLKSARSQTLSVSKRERQVYKDWSRYGLLPYLDLLIWSKETAHLIPHRVMAEAVDYRKGGDSFRKTVPPLAIKLIVSGGLAELEALAAIEASMEQLRP